MTKLTVADAVCAAFPHLRIDAIVAQGFSGHEPWPEVAERLSRLEADAASVLTRHWNHRDAERTKVTEHSEDIVFVLETVDAPAYGADLDAATASLTALLRTRARSVEVRVLTPARPACALPAR